MTYRFSEVRDAEWEGELSCLDHIGIPTVTQTFMKMYYSCPRKAFWRYRAGLVPKRSKRAMGLSRGTLVHELLRNRYATKNEAEAENAVREKVFDPARKKIESQMDEDLSGESEENLAVLERSWDFARMMVRLFWEKYPPADDIEVIDIERSILVPFEGVPGAHLAGQIDLVLGKDDQLWIVDHKTTSKPPLEAHTGMAYSYQKQHYRLLAESEYERPPTGFMYNYLMAPTIRYCSKDKTYEDYVERCKKWYKSKDYDTMVSYAVRINPDHGQDEREYAIQLVPPAIASVECRKTQQENWGMLWPRRRMRCFDYNRLCVYSSLCEACSRVTGTLQETIRTMYKQSFKEDQ